MNKDNNQVSSRELINILDQQARIESQADQLALIEAENIASSFGDQKSALLLVGMMAGRAQLAKTIADFSNVINLQTLKEVKESKNYKELKGAKTASGAVMTGTWDDFCQMIGLSRQMVDEQIKNADIFGMKALESLQSIGMGIRDLRRLRQLPDEELSAIIEGDTLKVNSKDEALDIIEEMAAKHRTETQQMNEQISTLEENKRATDRLLEDKNKRLLDIEKELEIAKGKGSPAKIKQLEAERFENLRQGVNLATTGLLAAIARFNDAVMEVRKVDHPVDVDDVCTSSIAQVVSRLIDSSSETGLYPDVMASFKAESDIFSGGNQ